MALSKPRTLAGLEDHVASAFCCGNLDRLKCGWRERIGRFNGMIRKVDFPTKQTRRGEWKRFWLRRCCGTRGGEKLWNSSSSSEEENERLVKMMREAQPCFVAHKGCRFVVILSAEIVNSPYLDTILKGMHGHADALEERTIVDGLDAILDELAYIMHKVSCE
ncbi:unnamed protein product [Camellia sinensis]